VIGRRFTVLAALASAMVLTTSLPVAAGTFGATTVIRTAAAGTEIRVADIAARDAGAVAVGWQENAPGGVKRVWLRRSSNGGSTFRSALKLDNRQSREIQVDTCDGWAFSAYTFREAGEWLVGLGKHALVGPYFEKSALTFGGLSRKPDVTCAGERLVVVWFQREGDEWRVKLHARGVNDEPKGDQLPEINEDLGRGTMEKGLAIAGQGNDVYIAWFDGADVEMRHYGVGPAPDRDLLGIPSALLPDMPDGMVPELGVANDRVVFAYMNEADLRARVSTNGAISWGPERTLENMPFPSEVGAYPTSADVIGTRIVVAGTIVGGIFDELNGEGFLKRTTNDGATWARVANTTIDDGQVVGAYRGRAGDPLLVMAWDKWIADPATDKLRFKRQS
jgi:hypothetical protein